jgi:hypothetical protein
VTRRNTLDHEALLTLVHKTEAAADDRDNERLETAAERLREAVVVHIDAERLDLLGLSQGECTKLLNGQQRVLSLLAELVSSARASRPRDCRKITQQLEAELSLQADDERRAGVSDEGAPIHSDHVRESA